MRKPHLRSALPLLLAAGMLTGCGYAGPEKAVRQELELVRTLDESTIRAFISLEDIQLGTSSQELEEEATEAVKLFFRDFKYKIRSSSVSEDKTSAQVTVDITNLDAKQLAKDLCSMMITNSVTSQGDGSGEGLAFSFALLTKCLTENEYETVTTQATVDLSCQDGSWKIQESEQLEDQLAGGLVSCLNDPYLLSPAEVLTCTLKPFKEFTGQQWLTYLELSDVFGAGTGQAEKIDLATAEEIAQFFDFQVGDVTQDGDRATAEVTVCSFDLTSVLEQCRESLLDYAKTTESIRASDEELSEKIGSLLLAALEENQAQTASTIQISLINNGSIWEVQFDDSFSDALLGGVDTAVDTFLSSLTEAETETAAETEETGGTETEA